MHEGRSNQAMRGGLSPEKVPELNSSVKKSTGSMSGWDSSNNESHKSDRLHRSSRTKSFDER